MLPLGVSSIMRSATVSINSWSCELNRIFPLKDVKLLLKACILSRSKWLVGVSSIKQLALRSCIRAIIHLIFSPPERTLTFFTTSSPENNILPRYAFICTSFPGPYCDNQSTKFMSLWKNSVLSSGR